MTNAKPRVRYSAFLFFKCAGDGFQNTITAHHTICQERVNIEHPVHICCPLIDKFEALAVLVLFSLRAYVGSHFGLKYFGHFLALPGNPGIQALLFWGSAFSLLSCNDPFPKQSMVSPPNSQWRTFNHL